MPHPFGWGPIQVEGVCVTNWRGVNASGGGGFMWRGCMKELEGVNSSGGGPLCLERGAFYFEGGPLQG